MLIKWANPQPAKIVVIDGADTEIQVLIPLFGGERFVVLRSDAREYCVTLPIIIWTLLYLLKTRSWRVAYALALLRRIRPAIVVTYIDNSMLFQQAAKLCRSTRFLAVQNGMRMLERDNPPGSPQIFHSEFACFGQNDVDRYMRHGAQVQHFYPVGSLKDAYHRARQVGVTISKRYDLCFVSQIKRQHYQQYPKTMQSLALLAGHLKRFCATHGTSLCVGARRHPKVNAEIFNWELAWYREHLGEQVDVIPNEPGEYTSYALIDQSRVSLAMHTTLLHEGFGRRNRILSCNFSGDARYDFPIPGPWQLSETDYAIFEARLLFLLRMSDTEYDSLCGDRPRYLMGYDPLRPTHDFLRALIADAVQAMPNKSMEETVKTSKQ